MDDEPRVGENELIVPLRGALTVSGEWALLPQEEKQTGTGDELGLFRIDETVTLSLLPMIQY